MLLHSFPLLLSFTKVPHCPRSVLPAFECLQIVRAAKRSGENEHRPQRSCCAAGGRRGSLHRGCTARRASLAATSRARRRLLPEVLPTGAPHGSTGHRYAGAPRTPIASGTLHHSHDASRRAAAQTGFRFTAGDVTSNDRASSLTMPHRLPRSNFAVRSRVVPLLRDMWTLRASA